MVYTVEEWKNAHPADQSKCASPQSSYKATAIKALLIVLVLAAVLNVGQLAQLAYNQGLDAGKAYSSQAAYKDGYQKGYATAIYDRS